MFDVSFFEIILLSVVALLVLGPERLPGAVRTAGLWIGRLKRSFNNIKKDIEKEIGADEIRRQLRNEAIMEKFDKTKTQFTKTIDSVKEQTESIKDDLNVKKKFESIKDELDLKKQFEAVTGTSKTESSEAASPVSEPAETTTSKQTNVDANSTPDTKADAAPAKPPEPEQK